MEYAPEIPNLPIIAKVIINGLKSRPESEIILQYSKNSVNSHSQKDQKLVFKTNYRLMQVKVLQNAPKGAFCNTFDLH